MKRIATLALALLIALSCGLYIPAAASTYASKTIASSSGALKAGSQSGQLKIEYSVSSNVKASSLGVESIKLYNDTGDYVTTIVGSVANGLIKKDSSIHLGTYYYDYATSGKYYYAEVNVFAIIDSEYDDYTHLTATVRAPGNQP